LVSTDGHFSVLPGSKTNLQRLLLTNINSREFVLALTIIRHPIHHSTPLHALLRSAATHPLPQQHQACCRHHRRRLPSAAAKRQHSRRNPPLHALCSLHERFDFSQYPFSLAAHGASTPLATFTPMADDLCTAHPRSPASAAREHQARRLLLHGQRHLTLACSPVPLTMRMIGVQHQGGNCSFAGK
jgi:hypothetical protein